MTLILFHAALHHRCPCSPDLTNATTDRFPSLPTAIGNAYAVLSNPEKRQQYDQYGDQSAASSAPQPSAHSRHGYHRSFHRDFEADISPEELFNIFFGGRFPTGVCLSITVYGHYPPSYCGSLEAKEARASFQETSTCTPTREPPTRSSISLAVDALLRGARRWWRRTTTTRVRSVTHTTCSRQIPVHQLQRRVLLQRSACVLIINTHSRNSTFSFFLFVYRTFPTLIDFHAVHLPCT